MSKDYLNRNTQHGNKKQTSGGKNSTAKPVSWVFGMTDEEIRKRMEYNEQVRAGKTKLSYDEYAKAPKVPSLFDSKTILTAPVVTKTAVSQKKVVPEYAPNAIVNKPMFYSALDLKNNFITKSIRDAEDAKKQLDYAKLAYDTHTANTPNVEDTNVTEWFQHKKTEAELKERLDNAAKVFKEKDYVRNSFGPRNSFDDLELSSNTVIDVEPLTVDNEAVFTAAQMLGTLQLVYLTDEQNICTTTRVGVPEISKHYLKDVKADTVFYDTVTGKFYQIVDDAYARTIRGQQNLLVDEINMRMSALEDDMFTDIFKASQLANELDICANKIKNGKATNEDVERYNSLAKQYTKLTSTDEFKTLTERYAERWSEIEKYQGYYDDLEKKYNELYAGTITASSDWYDNMKTTVEQVADARSQYLAYEEKMKKYYNAYDDTSEINSVGGGLHSMIGKMTTLAYWEQAWNESEYPTTAPWMRVVDVIDEVILKPIFVDFVYQGVLKSTIWETFLQPMVGWTSGDLSFKESFSAFGNNILVNLAETADAINFLKPILVAAIGYNNPEALAQDPTGTLAKLREEATSRGDYMDKVFVAWHGGGLEGGTLNVDYIWLAGEDPNVFDWVGAIAADILLDPSTWLTWGASGVARSGAKTAATTSLDTVMDFSKTVNAFEDVTTELTEHQVTRAMQKAGRQAIKTGADYSESVAKQLAKTASVADDLKISKALLGNISDANFGKWLINQIDDIELGVRKTAYSIQHPHMTRMYSEIYRTQAVEYGLKDMLTDAYKVIDEVTPVYKALDTIDTFMFNLVVPVAPISKVARVLKNTITTKVDAKRAAMFLERVASKAEHLADASGNIPLSALDNYLDIVAKEAKVFDYAAYDQLTNIAHRAIRTHAVDMQVDRVLEVVKRIQKGEYKTSTSALEDLHAIFRSMGTADKPINDFKDLIHYLTKPLGEAQHSVYDMLDTSVIGKLRTISAEYYGLVRVASIEQFEMLAKGVKGWTDHVNKQLSEIVSMKGVATYSELQSWYSKTIQVFDDSRKLFVDKLTKVTKTELNDAIYRAQQEVGYIFDAAAEGKPFMRTQLDDSIQDVQRLFDRYLEDVRNGYTRRYANHMDTKVEREVLSKAEVPVDKAMYSDFNTAFRIAIINQYGVEVTEEAMSNALLKSLNDFPETSDLAKLADETRVYTLMVEKSSRAAAYLSDANVTKNLAPFLGNTSLASGVLDTLKQVNRSNPRISSVVRQLDTFQKEAITLSETSSIYKHMASVDINEHLRTGVIDALSGEQKYINSIWESVDKNSAASISYATETITDHIVDKAAEFVMNSDGNYVTKLFSPVLESSSARVAMCSLDTAKNVENMTAYLDSIPQASKYLEDGGEEYVDIFFSLSKSGNDTSPYMITFKYGDETVTFKNKEARFLHTEEYVRNNHGLSYDAAKAEFEALNLSDGLSRADFDAAIDEWLMKCKALAAKDNKTIRFIGYNNGNMGTRQNRALTTYIRKNAITVHNDITIDLADFLRADRGMPMFTTRERGLVRDGVRRLINVSSAQRTNKLLTVFDDTLFADANLVVDSLRHATPDVSHVLNGTIMDSISNAVENLNDSVRVVRSRLGDDMGALQEVVVREKVIIDSINELLPSAHITGINIHALLEDTMSYMGGDYAVNAYKLVDTAKYKYLFNIDALETTVTVKDLNTLREVSNNMLGHIGRIKQQEVIDEIGVEAYKRLLAMFYAVAEEGIAHNDGLRVLAKVFDNPNVDPVIMFSACRCFLDNATVDITKFTKAIGMLDEDVITDVSNAWFTVDRASDVIFNQNTGTFTHSHKTFATKLYERTTEHAAMIDDMKQFDVWAKDARNLNDYINRKAQLQYDNGFVSAVEKLEDENFREIAQPLIDFIDDADVKILPPQAFSSRLEYVKHVAEQTEKVNAIKALTKQYGDVQHKAAMRTVFSFSDEDFTTYVLKDCKNNVIIDFNSSLMKDKRTRDIVIKRIDSWELLDKHHKKIMGDDGIVKLYVDTARFSDLDMDELYRTLTNKDIDYLTPYHAHRAQILRKELGEGLPAHLLKQKLETYANLEDALAPHLPAHWIVSTHTANTQATAKHLQDVFPEAAKINLDDMNQYGMFDESFTCSVWADSHVIRENQFIQYYSDDYIKSIGNGLYQVRNNMEAVKNKFALYNNKRMSLKWITEHSNTHFEDYQALNKVLEKDGLVLHRGVTKADGTVYIRRVTVETNAELRRILKDDSVIVSTTDEYAEMVQFMKDKNAKIKIDKLAGDSRAVYEMTKYGLGEARKAYITGALFANPGTWMRNGVDGPLKAVLETGDFEGFMSWYLSVGELSARYEEVFTKVVNKYHTPSGIHIARFFKEYPDEVHGLSLDTMKMIYAHKTSAASGNAVSSIIALQNKANFNKLLGLCEDTPEITEEVLNRAIKTYNKEARKAQVHPGRDFIKHKNNVRAALEAQGFSGKTLDKLTDLYYSHVYNMSAVSELMYNSPSLLARLQKVPMPDVETASKVSLRKSAASNMVTANSNKFSDIEDHVRLALFMYYTEDLGFSVSRASAAINKTQFDYAARAPWLDKLEGIFPFITFRLYNAKYWLFEAPKKHGVWRNMMKFTGATDPYYETEELNNIMRGMILRDKIASGELAVDDDGTMDYEDSASSVWAAFAHTILGPDGVVEEYQGQLRMYAEQSGSIPLGDNHVLKIGNSFLDAISFSELVMKAVPQVLNGEVPDLINNLLYTPIKTMLGAFKHYGKHGFNQKALNTWIEENWYDIIASIPFYGALVNKTITHMKNGRLNMQDLWMVTTNPQLKDEFLHNIYEQFLCVAGTVLPSFVGTVYEDDYFSRPIGYDWYNQDEEYRKTHRYVLGISYTPSWLLKHPGEYVNYKGMYMRLGYTEEEALDILDALFGSDSKAPIQWAFNQELFDETLDHLVTECGYSLEEALVLMKDKRLWNTDELAKKMGALTQRQAMENSIFYKKYDMLPDYIKYTDGQFSALRKHYREQGYSEDQIWILMWQGRGFISPTGQYKDITPNQAAAMNKEVNDAYSEFLLGLPEWYRYEPGASTRAVKYLQENAGMTVQEARDYIVANNFYVTEDGEAIVYTAEESKRRTEQSKKEFKEYYNTLPDVIKYEAGAFSRTLKYLRALGHDDATAKEMIKNGMYLTLDGELINCLSIPRKKQYNTLLSNKYQSAYRKYVPRPKRVRKPYVPKPRARRPYKVAGNNSMTYSLVNVKNGARFGTRNAYKVTLGYNSASAILSTKGNYPQTWRNVAQAYRRNLYKEHYAKYGMSRMTMRSGGWKGYSNASTTRLRRENIYAARRYRNRRVF